MEDRDEEADAELEEPLESDERLRVAVIGVVGVEPRWEDIIEMCREWKEADDGLLGAGDMGELGDSGSGCGEGELGTRLD